MAYNRTQLFANDSSNSALTRLAASFGAGQVDHEVIAPNLRYTSQPGKYDRVALEYFTTVPDGVLAPYLSGKMVNPNEPMLSARLYRSATAQVRVHMHTSYHYDENDPNAETEFYETRAYNLPLTHQLAQTAWSRMNGTTGDGIGGPVGGPVNEQPYWHTRNMWLETLLPKPADTSSHSYDPWEPQLQIKMNDSVWANSQNYLTGFQDSLHRTWNGQNYANYQGWFTARSRPAFPSASGFVNVTVQTGLCLSAKTEHYSDGGSGANGYATSPANAMKIAGIPIGTLTAAECVQLGMDDLEAWRQGFSGGSRTYHIVVVVPLNQLSEIPASELYPEAVIEFSSDFDRHLQRINNVNSQGGNTVSFQYRTGDMANGTWRAAASSYNLPERTEGSVGHTVTLRAVLNRPSHHFYGWNISYEEHDRVPVLDYPPPDLGGLPAGDWKEPNLPLRTLTRSRVTLRHPRMSSGMGGTVAYELNTGTRRVPQRYGEQLVISGTPPYVVYFDPGNASQPLSLVSEQTFNIQKSLDYGPAAWGGVEHYGIDRNFVSPVYEVLVGPNETKMGAFLAEFQPDRIRLLGPHSFTDTLLSELTRVKITSQGRDVTSGVITRVTSTPYANVRELNLELAKTLDYFNVDISHMDLTGVVMPQTEEEYIEKMLAAANYQGEVFRAPGIQFRKTEFWSKASPQGPGMVEEEVYAKYWNSQGGSVANELQAIANANMLSIHDLPDGNVFLGPIVPLVEKTLTQILSQDALLYCEDSTGKFVNDPRLNVSGITLALNEGFAEIEVEGYSNIAVSNFKPAPGPFVQGTGSNAKERPYAENTVSSGMFNKVQAWNYVPYQTRGGSVTDNLFTPDKWLSEAQVSATAKSVLKSSGGGAGKLSVLHSKPLRTQVQNLRTLRTPSYDGVTGGLMYPSLTQAQVDKLKSDFALSNTDYVYHGLDIRLLAEGWRYGTYETETTNAAPDAATLRILPLVGSYTSAFVPRWLPGFDEYLANMKDLKPSKAKRIQNAFLGEIGSSWTVQRPSFVEATEFNKGPTVAMQQLATWLTVMEFLKTRQVEVSFAGSQHWLPGQFISIARRPAAGEGATVTRRDLLMVLEISQADARVGGEAWVRTKCAYIGWRDYTNQENHNDMPLGWGATWEG